MNLENLQSSINKIVKKGCAFFYILSMSKKIHDIRQKKEIKVLFVLTELSTWKTENLYLSMMNHARFIPILGVATSYEDASYRKPLEDYLSEKQYKWESINGWIVSSKIKPDIIIYQKPYYDTAYFEDLRYDRHWNSLFCYVGYAFNTMDVDWAVKQGFYKFAWQIYFENELAASTRRPLMKTKGKNLLVTGMPIQDNLLKDKTFYNDPWKQIGPQKRIIYAPHHTIGDLHMDGINFSTFLTNAELILQLAEKYKDKVQWAFKPHPLLQKKLFDIWGKKRTEEYYNKWESLSYTQLAEGRYEALFKYSDAMIHDCSSFTIEYLYSLNPVLYLIKDDKHKENLNEFARQAFDLHYKASDIKGIEEFIVNVINGNDYMRTNREDFYRKNLIPPHEKTACENIINAILGIAEYK